MLYASPLAVAGDRIFLDSLEGTGISLFEIATRTHSRVDYDVFVIN
jgi:hypothetical protein